jgi:hypothetical protein
MKIDSVAIACFAGDLDLVRMCVASIRYWHPDIPIVLIKDVTRRNFSTTEIERHFDVTSTTQPYGFHWAKLSLLFKQPTQRILCLDSDIVLVGPLIDRLEQYDEDFIVTGFLSEDENHPVLARDYLDVAKTKAFDPSYSYPGYGINLGQIVITSGLLSEEDLEGAIAMKPTVRNAQPEIFAWHEQGPVNYVLRRAQLRGRLTMRYDDFWIWPGFPEPTPRARTISLEGIKHRNGTPHVLHWAGAKPSDFRRYPRRDILAFYESCYYSRIPGGSLKQKARHLHEVLRVKRRNLDHILKSRRLFRGNFLSADPGKRS